MKKNTQLRSTSFSSVPASLRSAAVLGLFVLAMLFAPLGRGMGLSAGQGLVQESGPSAAANALAASEVQGIVRTP